MDIAAWLDSLGLQCHVAAFVENEIDGAVLPSLTAQDLTELGVTTVGHRRKLLDAIALLREPIAVGKVPSPASDAERRHLTVMFVDLVGSTQLSSRLDPEDMRTILLAYQQAVAAAVARVEGHVAKYMGDGVLAYFGWPTAHENEGERAVRAGLAITAAMPALATLHGEVLAARVGIATGLVVVGDLIGEGASQEQAVVGDTPNLAARLQSIAAPGQVVVGDGTRALLGGMFEVRSLGEHELKGIGRTQAFAVVGERALESRFAARADGGLPALVGRDHELASLTGSWQAATQGHGQLVLLVGEAGMGKSRLCEALVERVAAEPHHRLRYQCSPYHQGSPLHPAVQQLLLASGIAATDPPDRRLGKLAARLQLGGAASPEAIALVADLLGIHIGPRPAVAASPQQQRFRTLQAIVDHVVALANDQPVLFLLEDAHWIDPTTRDLIEQGAAAFARARVALIVTTRPGPVHGFRDHAALQRIELGRLARDDVARIARHAGGRTELPAQWIDELIARSDGVPLYVEEMAKAAAGAGQLAAIPASLQDSLMARLDKHPAEKGIAQIAAVIGRAFSFRTLAAICPLREEELAAGLEVLTEAELVFREGLGPDASYLFKHGLVRDAAYESLLKAKRQSLHGKLVTVLEATSGTAPEVLALHASAANLPEKAIVFWTRAGDLAMSRPAYEEAIGHYGNAVALLVARPDARERELELRTKLGLASISAKGHSHPDTCATFEQALRMSEGIARNDLRFVSWYGLWCGHHVRSEVVAARDSSRELFAAASAVGEPSHRMMGTRALAISAVMSGDFAAGLRHHEAARALHDPVRDRAFAAVVGQDQTVSFRSYHAINLWVVGRAAEAWQLAGESIRLGKATGHVNSLGYGLMHATLVALCARRPELRELIDELIAFATEHRLSMWREFGAQFDAIERLGRGEIGSLVDLHEARRALAARHANLFSSLLALEAADRLIALRRLDDAEPLIAGAQQAISATGERYAEAEGHRLWGVLLAARGGDPTSAFATARDVARAQGAGAWEERLAATRLAR